jgi:phosphatidate cytidylyltransferase
MLRKRALTALWGIPLLVVAVWFDTPLPWFTVLAAVWGALAVLEFYRITGVAKALPLTFFGTAWTLFFVLNPHLGFPVPLVLTAGIMLSLIMLVLEPQREGAFGNWAWMLAGALYVGWLLGYLVALRLEAGRGWVFLAFFVTFASDSAAFFAGRALGRHRLAPHISPGKTWEGTIAGVLGAIIVSLLFTLPTPLQVPLSYKQAILLGIVVSVFGQLGDLAESLLKRNMNVKDSGSLMPGHGGLLDRMDSVAFAGVVVYLYYIFFVL